MWEYLLLIYFLISLPSLIYLQSSTSALINYFEHLLTFILNHFIFVSNLLTHSISIHILPSIYHIYLFVMKIVILIFLFLLLRLLITKFFIIHIAPLFINIFENLFYIFIIIFVLLLIVILFIFTIFLLFNLHLFY